MSSMRLWFGLALTLVVLISLVAGQGGRGRQGGHGSEGITSPNGWGGEGRGRGFREDCRACPSLPPLCNGTETPEFDEEGCVSCIELTAEIDGCTLDELEDCAEEWSDLDLCEEGVLPTRSNDTCCYDCRPVLTYGLGLCTIDQIKECTALFEGGDITIPVDTNTTNSTTNGTTTNTNTTLETCSNGTLPVYNASTCCVSCKVALESNLTAGDEGCTWEKFNECTAKKPVCSNGEIVRLDDDACCGSCTRPSRACDLATVARCYSATPYCVEDEVPQWLSGQCCPTCIFAPLYDCNCSATQICIRESSTFDNGTTTFTPTCKERADIQLSISATGNLADVFRLLNADDIRHLIGEYLRRHCDKPENFEDCDAFFDLLRDVVISTTLECNSRRTHGGDRRCDGNWGAGDGDEFKWANGTITADPSICTISVLISIALDDEHGGTPSSSSSSSSSTGVFIPTSSSTGVLQNESSSSTGEEESSTGVLPPPSESSTVSSTGELSTESSTGPFEPSSTVSSTGELSTESSTGDEFPTESSTGFSSSTGVPEPPQRRLLSQQQQTRQQKFSLHDRSMRTQSIIRSVTSSFQAQDISLEDEENQASFDLVINALTTDEETVNDGLIGGVDVDAGSSSTGIVIVSTGGNVTDISGAIKPIVYAPFVMTVIALISALMA